MNLFTICLSIPIKVMCYISYTNLMNTFYAIFSPYVHTGDFLSLKIFVKINNKLR